jgi:hypothetical protein
MNVSSNLIQARNQALPAALILLAGTLQIRR